MPSSIPVDPVSLGKLAKITVNEVNEGKKEKIAFSIPIGVKKFQTMPRRISQWTWND